MTGEDLYDLYADAMEFHAHVEIDDWSFLSSKEQKAWDSVAEGLEEKTL